MNAIETVVSAETIAAGNRASDLIEKAKAKVKVKAKGEPKVETVKAEQESITFLGNRFLVSQLVKSLNSAQTEAGKVTAIARNHAEAKQSLAMMTGSAPPKQSKIVGGKGLCLPAPSIVNELMKAGLLGDLKTPSGKSQAERLANAAKACDLIIDGLALLGVAYRR